MLETIFLFCAVIGGTVMVCQFAMTLLGAGDDFDTDFDADTGFDGDVSGDSREGGHHHDTSWLFGVISFRTLVAAVTFFGLSGYASSTAGQPPHLALIIAVVCGVAAMYGVYALMRAVYRLQSAGNQNIHSAVGQRGSVLVPVPANEEGVGKIQVTMQGRLVEFSSLTSHHEKLATGTRVEVVEVIGPSTVRIAPIVETDNSDVPHEQTGATSDS